MSFVSRSNLGTSVTSTLQCEGSEGDIELSCLVKEALDTPEAASAKPLKDLISEAKSYNARELNKVKGKWPAVAVIVQLVGYAVLATLFYGFHVIGHDVMVGFTILPAAVSCGICIWGEGKTKGPVEKLEDLGRRLEKINESEYMKDELKVRYKRSYSYTLEFIQNLEKIEQKRREKATNR